MAFSRRVVNEFFLSTSGGGGAHKIHFNGNSFFFLPTLKETAATLCHIGHGVVMRSREGPFLYNMPQEDVLRKVSFPKKRGNAIWIICRPDGIRWQIVAHSRLTRSQVPVWRGAFGNKLIIFMDGHLFPGADLRRRRQPCNREHLEALWMVSGGLKCIEKKEKATFGTVVSFER